MTCNDDSDMDVDDGAAISISDDYDYSDVEPITDDEDDAPTLEPSAEQAAETHEEGTDSVTSLPVEPAPEIVEPVSQGMLGCLVRELTITDHLTAIESVPLASGVVLVELELLRRLLLENNCNCGGVFLVSQLVERYGVPSAVLLCNKCGLKQSWSGSTEAREHVSSDPVQKLPRLLMFAELTTGGTYQTYVEKMRVIGLPPLSDWCWRQLVEHATPVANEMLRVSTDAALDDLKSRHKDMQTVSLDARWDSSRNGWFCTVAVLDYHTRYVMILFRFGSFLANSVLQ